MDANLTTRTWILLLLCNLFWAGNSVAAKIILDQYDWLQAAWLRTASTAASMILGIFAFRLIRAQSLFQQAMPRFSKSGTLKWVIAGGLLTFVGSPVFYAFSLVEGKAVEATWVVVLEPVILFFLAAVFLGEKIGRMRWLSFALATLGFLLFAKAFEAGTFTEMHRVPFFWMLLGATCDGVFSIVCRKAVDEGWRGLAVFWGTTWVGAVVLTLILGFSHGWGHSFPRIGTMHLRTILALLWVGPVGTALTFGYWVVNLEKFPVSAMTLTLYLQPIFGSLFAYVLLRETLDPVQWVGSALIIAAAFLSSRSGK
ncbi:MAG: DMT family transporter [Bdellovibrionales bacterium]|nr:DMT family transporter [Bdellovibrionales bacterium]